MFIPQIQAAWQSLRLNGARHLPAVGYSGLAAMLLTQIPATQAFVLGQNGEMDILITLLIWTVLLVASRAYDWCSRMGDAQREATLGAFALSGLAALALTAMPVMAINSLQQDLLASAERPWIKSIGPMALVVFCALWATLLCAIWFTQQRSEDD